MPVLDDVMMHRDNRQTKYAYAMWEEDPARWRAEHSQAAAWLTEVEAAWDRAEEALQSHARIVRAHELRLQRHERAVNDFWFDGSDAEQERLAKEHEKLKTRHLQAQAAHERLKQVHESAMAEIRELLKLTISGSLVEETFA